MTPRNVRDLFHCQACEVGWTGKPGPCWCCGWTDNVTAGQLPMPRQIIAEIDRPWRAA